MKKLLASILAVTTLATLTVLPIGTNAITEYDSTDDMLEYYQENAIKEAVIVLEDAEEWSGTYYFGVVNKITPSIPIDGFTDDEISTLRAGFPVKIDDSVDVSAVETVLTFSYGTDAIHIPIDDGYSYTNLGFDIADVLTKDEDGNIVEARNGSWEKDETSIPKPDEDATIGDSDATVGDSTVTGLRGDVNLDGEVNGLDLLMLKKYIIGLISW